MLRSIVRLRPVVKLRDGSSFWMEKSELKLPKGGKKMDFGLKFFFGLFGGGAVLVYVMMQAEMNPDSFYGKFYNIVVNEGTNYFFKEKAPEDNLDPNIAKGLFT
uniref:Mitochondrial cytochrome c oxidase subunit VIc/VIIs domain-containing protein n=1 Tax=Panagrolaimus sp. JU765 TaxID=591449 RepID=A0AC34RMF5_9BILA